MKIAVALSVCGRQFYPGQAPEEIELVTDGTLEYVDGGWNICYEESDLTGLAGAVTTFRLEPGTVILRRTGSLRSEMVFQEGIAHDSLYQLDFGALMVTVCAQSIEAQISNLGGTVDLRYAISIENSDAGLVEYHLEVRPKGE